MLHKALAAIMALALASVCASATTINPTTTLAAETANNTSAASSWTTSINGDVKPGNVSKVDHHTLLYPGATTPIYSNIMYWFGPKNHIQVGYNSGTIAQIHKQVDDHLSRGLNGTIVDWYGTGHALDNNATIALKQYAESLAGTPFKFAIMEDKGALLSCANTNGCDLNKQLITDLTYVWNTFAQSPAYIRINGRPAVFFFGLSRYSLDWSYVRSKVPGNMLYIFPNQGGFSNVHADGAYAWVQLNTSGPNDWNVGYLDNYYLTANKYPNDANVGATYKGFDDRLAAWSENRIMNQNCGQTWLKTWNEVKKYYSEKNPLDAMQIVTWNDYEEGTEIETGIENCVSVSGSMNGATLTWNISGQENTIDHYEVFASLNGQNLERLALVDAGIHNLDMVQFSLDPAIYTLYVKAVGKPSMTNKMSGPITFALGTAGPLLSLAVTPTSGVAPVTVAATVNAYSPSSNLSTATIDFGDGTVAQGTSASHTYKNAGTYTVTAKIVDSLGKSVIQTKNITVTNNRAPVAAIALNMANGVAPVAITASSAMSSDTDGYIASSTINFGDGSAPVSASKATHTYVNAGTYAVTVTVKDDKGAQSSASATVTLKAAAVTITTPATSLTSLSPVHLAANALVPTGRTMTAMKVYVDNATVFSTSSTWFDKSFAMALGKHNVTVKAWDNTGALYSDAVTVTVMAKAGVSVTTPAAGATVGSSAHFVASATPPAGKTIAAMRVYVDGAQKYASTSAALDTYLTLAKGSRAVVIQAWDNSGAVYKWSTTLTVK